MAVKDQEDKSTTQKDVDLSKGDININFKSDELKKFEISPKKAPHNKAVDGKPLDTSKDEYNDAKRVGGDEGQEGIKASREKFAKQKDVPSGIASADIGVETIFKSLMQTDPGKQSQVMPEMYMMFSMILNILMSAGSGQTGQSQSSLEAGANPNNYTDLSEGTKDIMISSMTNALSIITTTYGYKSVIGTFRGMLNNDTIKLIPPDFQDIIISSLTLLYKLIELYGEKNIPKLRPTIKSKLIKADNSKVINTVTFAYNSILYRKPETAGLEWNCQTFVVDIDTYNIGTAIYNLVQRFLTSAEYNNIPRKKLSVDETYIIMIRMMYLMILNREGESSGIKFWQQTFLKYIKQSSVIEAIQRLEIDFMNSDEYKTNLSMEFIANRTDRNVIETIEHLYNSMLLRKSDAIGLDFWTTYISDKINETDVGTAIYDVFSQFKNSQEFIDLVSNSSIFNKKITIEYTYDLEQNITKMYNTILNRNPDPEGLVYWLNYYRKLLSNDKPMVEITNNNTAIYNENVIKIAKDIEKLFLSSAEYRNSFSKEYYQIIIDCMYLMILGREGDPEGSKYWTSEFENMTKSIEEPKVSQIIGKYFLSSQEYKDINIKRTKFLSSIKVKTNPSDYSLLTFYNSYEDDPYPGYARWITLDGSEEFTIRNSSLPYFQSPDIMTVYLIASVWKDELESMVKGGTVSVDLFLLMLYKYARKVEDIHGDLVLGYNTSKDRSNSEIPFNGGQGQGGGGGNNMLGMLLPLLMQLLQQAKSEHLPNSVLDKGKMNKLLQNMERKKTENKRMMNLADSGITGGGNSQLNSLFNGDISSMMNQFTNINSKNSSGGKTTDGGTVSPSTITTNNPTTKYGVSYTGNLEQNIKNMYITILGRMPDAAGLKYWLEYYRKALLTSEINKVTQDIENYFLSSEEYKIISSKKVTINITSYDKLINLPGIKGLL